MKLKVLSSAVCFLQGKGDFLVKAIGLFGFAGFDEGNAGKHKAFIELRPDLIGFGEGVDAFYDAGRAGIILGNIIGTVFTAFKISVATKSSISG